VAYQSSSLLPKYLKGHLPLKEIKLLTASLHVFFVAIIKSCGGRKTVDGICSNTNLTFRVTNKARSVMVV
jgi:hypothetical protein